MLQGVSLALGFVSQVFVARLTGVAGYGAYSYALAWAAMVVQPSLLGIDRILIRELAIYRHAGRFGLMRGLLRRSDQIALIGACACAAVIAAIALPVSSDALRGSVAVGVLTIPLAALGRVRQVALQGLRRASLGLLTLSVGRTAYFILFLAAAAGVARSTHMRPETAVGMQVLAFAAALATGSLVVRRSLPREVMRSTPEFQAREWARGLPTLAIYSALSLLNNQVGVILIGVLGTASDAGRFNAALRSAAIVSLAVATVGPVIAPRISVLFVSGDRAGMERLLMKTTNATTALALPPALFLLFVGPWFIGLFGHGFRDAGTALLILVGGEVFNAATGVVGVALLMTKHERAAAIGMLGALCLNIGLCAVLVPVWGTNGAAVAATASTILFNVLFIVAAARKLGISPNCFGVRFLRNT